LINDAGRIPPDVDTVLRESVLYINTKICEQIMTINQPRRKLIKQISLVAFSCTTLGFTQANAKAKHSSIYTSESSNDAMQGYDTVSYFKDGKPVKGSEQYSTVFKDARWLFSSEENRQAFIADPDFYMPQYGGYCAFSVTKGKLVKGDAKLWVIVDEKLYVNYNKGVHRLWLKRQKKMIKKANKNWPSILS